MKIRKATKKDLKKIAEIFRIESAKKPYLQKRNRKKALDKIKEYFKNEDIYISILNNKIAGFIIVNIDTTEKKKLFRNLQQNFQTGLSGQGSWINQLSRILKQRHKSA